MSNPITITLPWPPSVNAIWKPFRNRIIMTADGREYRKSVAVICMIRGFHRQPPITAPLEVWLDAYLPDRRKHDVDNLPKAPFDALTHAGVWKDDNQIRRMHVDKFPPAGNPRIVIRIAIL